MKDGTKLKLPDELNEVGIALCAAQDLRSAYVKRPFGYKKAMRAGRDYERLRGEFWRKVAELYPELKGNSCYYRSEDRAITIGAS